MSVLVDVALPGPWWTLLTYEAAALPVSGTRLLVPVGNGTRVGFAVGPSLSPPMMELRSVLDVLDVENPLGQELWELLLWVGKTFLCGSGLALMAACPAELLGGAPLPSLSVAVPMKSAFQEEHCFSPMDGERMSFYRRRAEGGGRSLFLFPEARTARHFFSSLPASVRAEAVLWPSSGGKKLWDVWQKVRAGNFRIVVAPPGGVFAPFAPEQILVDEEASPAYIAQRPPRFSARSIAGRRAVCLGAALVLGGRMPSAKTFLRSRPPCSTLPDRREIVFADIRRSLMGEERGVDGAIPLAVSLLDRTRQNLSAGRHVLWILDRRGEAAEVFCQECGHSIRCGRCGGTMRSEASGRSLRGVRCGLRAELPSRCPACGGELWMGRRPGIEALAAMAGRLVRGYPVLLHDGKKMEVGGPSIIVGTRGSLSLCDRLDVGLAAWLDLDAELRRPEYGARFQVFSMIWESCWRGRAEGVGRTVLVQGRRFGSEWRTFLTRGWDHFWRRELALRAELDLPPSGLLIQVDLPKNEDRGAMIRMLEDAGLFVMDPGDAGMPLWLTPASIDEVSRALAPRFAIGRSRSRFPVVTVWAE